MIPRQASICAQIIGFTIYPDHVSICTKQGEDVGGAIQVESKLVPCFSNNLAMKYALKIPQIQALFQSATHSYSTQKAEPTISPPQTG